MPEPASAPKGTLVAIGGNEDKTDDMVILRRTLEAVRGEAKNAIVVAAASREPVEASRPYLRAFEDLGLEHVRPLDLQSRREVEEERTLRRLREADVVYFTGGDQLRLADALRGSEALSILRQRYQSGAVIAGTSAGAAAMSATMIARGDPEEGLSKGNVELDEGLGLIPNVIVDTHFIQRGRFSRLLEAVAHHPELLGIGIAEDTAFVLREGRYLEVVGSDNVIVVDGREIRDTNTREARRGENLTVERAIVHALAEGYWFDLQDRVFYTPKQAAKEVPA
jgi:cyanophycinase